LAGIINDVAARRGCLIIPAFAIGRTQELLYTIGRLEDDGVIPPVPVHVDSPMGIEATEIYCRHTGEHDFEMAALRGGARSPISSKHLTVHRTPEQSKSINKLQGPVIIISASGMATGGRVLHHLKERLPEPTTTVLLVGYQAEGTRGRSLQDGAEEIKMLGQIVPVRAQIRVLDGFSAHADQMEILRWLKTFKKAPRRTYIVHGEARAASALAQAVRKQLNWAIEIAKFQQRVTLA
jgi:metallo-beta-lactamase family protein